MTGGAGADTFTSMGVTGGSDSATTAKGDIITDFNVAEDKLDLEVTTFGGAFQAATVVESTATLSTGTYYAFSGTFVASSGLFTLSTIANGGFSTLITKASAVGSSGTLDVADGTVQAVILDSVLATSVTTSNIV